MHKIICLLFIVFVTSANAQNSIDHYDFTLLQKLEEGRTAPNTKVLKTISDINNYVNVAIPVGLFVAGVADKNPDMRRNALYIASSAASTALLNLAIKQIFKRRRPFVTHVSLTPVYRPGGYSFPSGHTSLSFASATSLAHAYPKWYIIAPSFLWAGTVGFSRMYLGVHNPSDVTAGALLGIGTSAAFMFLKK